MIRKEIYNIEQVLSLVGNWKIAWDGDLIKMNSQRYQLFKQKGITCVECGIKGAYFAKERDVKCPTYHFNLYALNGEGERS